jgi:hypothetical protein
MSIIAWARSGVAEFCGVDVGEAKVRNGRGIRFYSGSQNRPNVLLFWIDGFGADR